MSALLITHQVQIHFKGPQQHVQQFEIALSSTGGKEEKKKKEKKRPQEKLYTSMPWNKIYIFITYQD